MATNFESQQSRLTLEQRLQPWFDQAEYLIILTITFMAWAAGWVDLLGYESDSNVIFGRYSLPYTVLLIVYMLGFVVIAWTMINLRLLARFKGLIAALQARPWLVIPIWIVFGVVIWTMLGGSIAGRNLSGLWQKFRLLEVAVLVLMVLFTCVVLLTRPVSGAPIQRWRFVALALIGLVIGAEVVLQVLSAARVLTVDNLSGVTVPYGRIYQQSEGFGNGTTNGFGWYYPDFRLENGSRRIVLSGDTFVEALQIPVSAHMGVQLDELINAAADTNTEVMAMGMVGYGPMTFMNWRYFSHLWQFVDADEIVIVFHLANDFYIESESLRTIGRVAVDADGMAEISDEDFNRWHTLADLTVLGHSAPDPMRTLVSQSQLLNVAARDFIARNFRLSINHPRFPSMIDQVSPDQPFGPATLLFEVAGSETAEQSFDVTAAILHSLVTLLEEYDLTFRIVTIPFFPAEFYADNSGNTWSPEWRAYDLLLPERRLAEAAQANGVSFLGMGQYMLDMSPAQLRALYFNEGTGHLTEAGHRVFAEAMYNCFYSEASDSRCGRQE